MYHFNPKTGDTGLCRATKGKCPFGDDVHFETELEAHAAFENSMVSQTLSSTSKSANKKPSLAVLQRTLLPEDLEYGRKNVRTWLGNNSQYSFGALMGEKSRMTDKKLAEYDAKLDELIDGDDLLKGRVLEYARQHAARELFARAHQQGIPTPLDSHFEEIWEGKAPGFGREFLEKRLVDARKRLEELNAGKVSPTKIVGAGYRNPKKVAREWLEGHIRETEHAIETRGRSETVNIANAEYRVNHPESDAN